MAFERSAVVPKKWKVSTGASSPAIRAGDLLFIGAQHSIDDDNQPLHAGDVRGQARVSLERIREIVRAAGGTLDDIVDVVAFFLDIRDAGDVLGVAGDLFKKDFPAWTFMGTQGLEQRGSLVQIHAVAHLGKAEKKCFTPESLRWWRK